MRQRAVLLSVDGPRSNVLKFKPPMCFTTADVDTLAASLDGVLTDVEAGGHLEGVATGDRGGNRGGTHLMISPYKPIITNQLNVRFLQHNSFKRFFISDNRLP